MLWITEIRILQPPGRPGVKDALLAERQILFSIIERLAGKRRRLRAVATLRSKAIAPLLLLHFFEAFHLLEKSVAGEIALRRDVNAI